MKEGEAVEMAQQTKDVGKAEMDCDMEKARKAYTVVDTRKYEEAAQGVAKTCNLSIPNFSAADIREKATKEIDFYMDRARQAVQTVAAARKYERKAKAVAKTYGLAIPNLSQADIRAKATQERDIWMEKARHSVITVADAREFEKEAQHVAKTYDLSIPNLSDAEIRKKATKERDFNLQKARHVADTVVEAREYEKKAQVVAKANDIPILELSDADIREKATQERDHYWGSARKALTMVQAREYEKKAQIVAKAYNIAILEFSDADIRAKATQERDFQMYMARRIARTVAQAREYEEVAQAVAKTYDIPILELSDAEIRAKAIQERDFHLGMARDAAITVACARKYEEEALAVAKAYNIPTLKLSDGEMEVVKLREEGVMF